MRVSNPKTVLMASMGAVIIMAMHMTTTVTTGINWNLTPILMHMTTTVTTGINWNLTPIL
jgi:hypothetical protein